MSGLRPRPDTPARPDLVHDAVRTVPGVHGLSRGVFGEVGSYRDGRRIDGVRWIRGRCEVHVVARFGTDLPALAELIRTRLVPLVDGPVDVVVTDICAPDDPDPRGRP